MKDIQYLKQCSKFYLPIKEYVEEHRSQVLLGEELSIEFDSHAYTQRPIKAQIGERFLADFSGVDTTRFCARLKALATVLRDLKLPGYYMMSHQKGVCRFQKTDIDEAEIESSIVSDESRNSTMREALIQSRVGQGVFRKKLIEKNKKCVLTGVEDHQFLKASHIKPWRCSNDTERLDPDNGLLLSPHVDHLFDGGWITFDENGKCRCSSKEIENILELWGIEKTNRYFELSILEQRYMSFHRQFIFQG